MTAKYIDPRRIVKCQSCGTVLQLTAKWLYPDHPDPKYPGTGCRMSRLASGLDMAWEIVDSVMPGSALGEKIALEIDIIAKTNELVLALAQQERLKAQKRTEK